MKYLANRAVLLSFLKAFFIKNGEINGNKPGMEFLIGEDNLLYYIYGRLKTETLAIFTGSSLFKAIYSL